MKLKKDKIKAILRKARDINKIFYTERSFMESKEIFYHQKSGTKSKGAWTSLVFGILLLIFGDGIIFKIIGLLMTAYGAYMFTRKTKVSIYKNGFILTNNTEIKNIFFDRVLWIKAGFNQKIKILHLEKPISEYSETELWKEGSNEEKIITFDDELFEKDFKVVFNRIEEEFKNYIFEKYNGKIMEIIDSPYLMKQIENDNLSIIEKNKEKIELQNGDSISVKQKKKAYVTNGRQDLKQAFTSFEPIWSFASNHKKLDTVYLYNRSLIKQILLDKYNVTWDKNN